MKHRHIIKTILLAGALSVVTGCNSASEPENKIEVETVEESASVKSDDAEQPDPDAEVQPEMEDGVNILGRIEGEPTGLAVLGDGRLLVTDRFNKTVWEISGGELRVYAGEMGPADAFGEPVGGYRDNELAKARFQAPWGLAEYLDGWAIADGGNGCIRWMDEERVRTAAYKDSERVLEKPTGLAGDEQGNIYIADAGADTVYRMDTDGNLTVVAAGFRSPADLCWENGILYVADTGNHRICAVQDGSVSVVAGGAEGYADGDISQAAFRNPQGIAVDGDGIIYVADTGNNAIRKIDGDTVSTLLAATDELIWPVSPTGIVLYQDGLAVTDSFTGMVFAMPKN